MWTKFWNSGAIFAIQTPTTHEIVTTTPDISVEAIVAVEEEAKHYITNKLRIHKDDNTNNIRTLPNPSVVTCVYVGGIHELIAQWKTKEIMYTRSAVLVIITMPTIPPKLKL